LGRVPLKGEQLDYANLRMVIHGGDQKRITRVLICSEQVGAAADSSTLNESVP